MDKNISVAHINFAKGFRGGERQTELLISRLADRGLTQILLCRKGSPLAEHLRGVANLRIVELEKVVDLRLQGHGLVGSKVDIVQAHETRGAQWALVHHMLCSVPYVVTRRVTEPVRENFFNRKLYGNAAAVVAISSCIRSDLQHQFKRQIDLISDSCAGFVSNENAVRALAAQYGRFFVIGNIAALVDKVKGQTTLIKAAHLLRHEISNLKVLFLGIGKDEQLFREHAADLIKDGLVEFLGFKTNVADYLKIMDVFAFPSNSEGLGSVLLDAMDQGVPVVASAVGGIPDIVKNNETGLLIGKGDAEGLAEAVLRIRDSEQLKDKLISGGHMMAKQCSPENIAEKYHDLYLRSIKGRE